MVAVLECAVEPCPRGRCLYRHPPCDYIDQFVNCTKTFQVTEISLCLCGVYRGGYQSTPQGSGYVAEYSAIFPCQSGAKARDLVQQYLSATCVKIVLTEFFFFCMPLFIKSAVGGRLSDSPSGRRARVDPLPACDSAAPNVCLDICGRSLSPRRGSVGHCFHPAMYMGTRTRLF